MSVGDECAWNDNVHGRAPGSDQLYSLHITAWQSDCACLIR